MLRPGRILEILPAFFSWSAILLPIALSFHYPQGVAIFIVVFSAMWFVRAIEFTGFLIFSFFKYRQNQKVAWREKIKSLNIGKGLTAEEAAKRHKLLAVANFIPPAELVHIVIVATYREPLAVLRESIGSVARAHYDLRKIYLCLATEERDSALGRENAAIIEREFGHLFGRFFWTEHPDGLADEVKGKGGNITHAGREVARALAAEGADFSRYLITTLDADNRVHADYFSAMTYGFCLEGERKHRSFQPLSFFFNNIWEVPILNRTVSLSSGFWHMIENGRPDRLRNFASHAQPLAALAEMDFWATDTIVEDGHQYWRSYLHFNGNYAVTPVFIPIYQDAMQEETWWKSLKGQFLQLRRWAWGVTDIPFMVKNWWRMRRKLPFGRTALQFYRLCEGHFMWATAPILITLTTPVPRLLNKEFGETVFAANASLLIGNFFAIALSGLFVALAIAFAIMPSPKRKIKKLILLLQLVVWPPVTILFGALPALTAQTILASGRKLEFNVTVKVRKGEEG